MRLVNASNGQAVGAGYVCKAPDGTTMVLDNWSPGTRDAYFRVPEQPGRMRRFRADAVGLQWLADGERWKPRREYGRAPRYKSARPFR